MNQPVQSETGAFRILQIGIGTCTAVALIEAVGGGTADVVAFSFITAAVLARLLLLPRDKQPRPQAPPARAPNVRHRILVIATTKDTHALARDMRTRADENGAEVLLVCPALNSRLAHWVSDVDAAELEAKQRLDEGLGALEELGVHAFGEVGDPDPLQAIQDALWVHGADQIVLATRSQDAPHWLERRLAERARARYLMPIEQLADAPVPEAHTPEYAPVGGLVAEATMLATSPAIAGSAETGPPAP